MRECGGAVVWFSWRDGVYEAECVHVVTGWVGASDPAQGETGGKSLTSKFKAKVPHSRVKDKVKNLKNRLPGMKKHAGGDDEGHDDSSEYDEGSPRVSAYLIVS